MSAKPLNIPGRGHPITIERNPLRVRVIVAGRTIANTTDALTLRAANYPPVQYVPRKDVEMSLLRRSDHTSYCPYKGEASYYNVMLGDERSVNAIWTYETPYPSVVAIKDHVAFYPERVDSI